MLPSYPRTGCKRICVLRCAFAITFVMNLQHTIIFTLLLVDKEAEIVGWGGIASGLRILNDEIEKTLLIESALLHANFETVCNKRKGQDSPWLMLTFKIKNGQCQLSESSYPED
jgi:hypothetical protein